MKWCANVENAEGLFSEEETSTDGDEEMFEDEKVYKLVHSQLQWQHQ